MNAAVLYDGLNLVRPHPTGIGTYARTLAKAAESLGVQAEALLSSNRAVRKGDAKFNEVSLFDAAASIRPDRRVTMARVLAAAIGRPFGIATTGFPSFGSVLEATSPLAGFKHFHVAPGVFNLGHLHFRRYGRRAEVRLDSTPSLAHFTAPIPLKARGVPNIYTIHDLVPVRLPQATLDNKGVFIRLVKHLCESADHIVTVSEYVRRDIMEWTGIDESRITNTYQAVNLPDAVIAKSDEEVARDVRAAFGLRHREYYLFYGAIEPKKNISFLIDAYAESGSPYPLVIVGGLGWLYENDLAKIEDDRFFYYQIEDDRIIPTRRVRRFAYLPSNQLMTLVKGARGLLFPSLYEGFGLPIVEAMALGTPVITSTAGSLPEVSGSATVLTDPLNSSSLASAIRDFDNDRSLRQQLVADGKKRAAFFDDDHYATRLGDVYRKLGVPISASRNPAPVRSEQEFSAETSK